MATSFDNLPHEVGEILKKVENIENLISKIQPLSQPDSDKWFSLEELCEYLPGNPAKATIYEKVSKRTIPFHKEAGGKRLAFRKSEIDDWLNGQRRKTVKELEEDASNLFKRKK